MDNWNLMKRRALVALLMLVSLICVRAGNVFAQERKVETAGGAVQTISFDSTLPQPNANSALDTEKILKGDKLSAKTHNDRGIKYSEKGQYDLALSEFNKALEIFPSSAETYNNRGITYSKKGDLDRAIADFTKALKLNPDSAKAHYNRGITYAIRGQIDLALLDLKKCLELDPTNAAAYDSRGSVFVGLACSEWGKACQLGNCDHLREAVKIGFCIAATDNNPLSLLSEAP
jgi:Flp pilus assembly protein TadD